MNYYPHHIGDFNNATRHLTRIERSIYRDMIELYYDTEQTLALDIKALCRKLLAREEQEVTAVEQVLNEFFTKTAQGWHHTRCELVIAEYKESISAKSAAGKASAAKRAEEREKRLAELNSSSTDDAHLLDFVGSSVQLTNNQEPITNNQEPLKTNAPTAEEYSAEFESAWESYPSRPGANKKNSYKAWNARLKAGVDFVQITLGVVRYASYCSTMKVDPKYIKQPETFFGPSEHYLNDWKAAVSSGASSSSRPSRHVGFDKVDYSEGVNDDGRI